MTNTSRSNQEPVRMARHRAALFFQQPALQEQIRQVQRELRQKASEPGPAKDLMQIVASEAMLCRAYAKTMRRAKRRSPRVRPFLKELQRDLLAGTYKPRPATLSRTRAGNKKERDIAIAQPRDAVVLRALQMVLVAVIGSCIPPCAFGWLPGRGRGKALDQAADHLRHATVVVRADVNDFFGSIRRRSVYQRLKRYVSDPAVLRLVKEHLDAPCLKNGRKMPPGVGIPVGSPLSQLLADVVLAEVDAQMQRSGWSGYMRSGDDFLIAVDSEADAARALADLRKALRGCGLTLNPAKTSVQYPHEGVLFAGRILRRSESGVVFRLAPEGRANAIKKKIAALAKRHSGSTCDFLTAIDRCMQGWQAEYRTDPALLKEIGQVVLAEQRHLPRLNLEKELQEPSRMMRVGWTHARDLDEGVADNLRRSSPVVDYFPDLDLHELWRYRREMQAYVEYLSAPPEPTHGLVRRQLPEGLGSRKKRNRDRAWYERQVQAADLTAAARTGLSLRDIKRQARAGCP